MSGTSIHGRSTSSTQRKPKCSCGKEGIYDEFWDRYYCPESGTWLEDKCKDVNCKICISCPEIHKL